ncbi:MAG: hypothetical protein KatS3mg034_1261 [Vicingaceae bacterium]|nr:MAG: hypothetical protein KatS3mg034_1261 [Vicingaceae bacterium]
MKLLFSFLMAVFYLSLFGQNQKENNEVKSKLYFGLTGNIHMGRWGVVPVVPHDGNYPAFASGVPYTGKGLGIQFNWLSKSGFSVYFDVIGYSKKIDVAHKGGYASSPWVSEMTGYQTDLVGPFDEDAYFMVNTYAFRIGPRYYFFPGSSVRPWFGMYLGYYSYIIGIYNKNKTATWGSTNGETTEINLINLGTDFFSKDKSVVLSLFFEYGGVVPKNNTYTIENCLVNGWTYKSEGGLHLIGYTRMGISIGM